LFGKILKAVAKIGASTAGFMYGGPLGAAAASAAVSKLTGDSWKSALTTGAISGITSGIGSYASGVGKGASGLSRLGEVATTSGKTIASRAADMAIMQKAVDAGSAAVPSAVVGSGADLVTTNVGPGMFSGAAAAPAAATGLSALGSNIMNAGYGVLGAGLGAGISNKGTPATPLPTPYQVPYDPNNVFSWMRPNRGGLLPGQTPRSPIPQPDPMDVYNQGMGYADGGDVAPVGMGLPQSAAMPQLMSAAQFGYLNARTGGMIAGPGDGKSDDIPALLSNGEHVIDAATVSDLGNGDNDTGQKRLEEIKHKIRSSAGRKNPRKASPKQKGLGSLLNSARA
jgi:hypothetical protein